MSFLSNTFSGIGTFLNDITGVTSQQNRTYKQQRESAAYQNAYNTQMWNLQNQYNTPVAQLARMREAGIDINPTSYALGTGNLSNTATFVGSENGFSGSGSPAGNPITSAVNIANGISEFNNRNANTEYIEAQTRNLTNYLDKSGPSTYDPQVERIVDAIPGIVKKGGQAVKNKGKSIFNAIDSQVGLSDAGASFLSWLHRDERAKRQAAADAIIKKNRHIATAKKLLRK